jgi:glycerate 2-kinase
MTLINYAENIWRAALDAAEPRRIIEDSVQRRGNILEIAAWTRSAAEPAVLNASTIIDLDRFANVYLIALGKAAPGLAAAIIDKLGPRLLAGIVVALPGKGAPIMTRSGVDIRVIEAPHPHPDIRSSEAARVVLALAYGAGDDDLVVVLLSGGGSAQVALPLPGLTLEDKARIARDLMLRGAGITELNVVRKHLSAVKGGRLAEAAFPATLLNLAISDVAGDDFGTIASGLSYWDSSTYSDARRILEDYGLWDGAPSAIKKIIEHGQAELIPETPKKKNPAFDKVTSLIIGNNALAIGAARRKADELGFETIIAPSPDNGDARAAAKDWADRLIALAAQSPGRTRPLCVIGGGELTVRVRGKGRGGRNQEFALAVLSEVARSDRASLLANRDWLVASLGTDGIDGNSDAAGAWVSPQNLARARELGLDIGAFLDDNDSHTFFSRAGGLIVTGPTGTNVMDLRVMLLR